MMEDDKEPVYASKAKPWLKYYEEKYIHQSVPECSAFALVCRNNERHLGDTALEYYGRKFSYADLIVQIKKTAERRSFLYLFIRSPGSWGWWRSHAAGPRRWG